MTATQIIAAARISKIWVDLGGDPPHNGRARAFYRGGDNPSAVSLNDLKACYFDHRDHVGGGVLGLVQHVRGGDRLSALRWLADLLGLPLDGQHTTVAERREHARQAWRAMQEAADLVTWKGTLLDGLKRERDTWWALYHASLRYLLDVGLEAPLSDLAVELHELAEVQVEIWNGKMEALAEVSYQAILPVFRETRVRADK